MVLLAGPVPGIIIGLVLFALSGYYDDSMMLRLSYAFVLLNLLNLLPVYPLDGGQLIKTLFLGSKQLVSDIFVIASIVVITGYALYNHEWFVLIIPYFLVRRFIADKEVNRVRRLLKSEGIDYECSFNELSDEEYWQIRDAVAFKNLRPSLGLVTGNHEPAENENDVIIYIKSILQPRPFKDLSVAGGILFLAIWLSSFILPAVFMMPGN